jgi:uncharacterized repeat protein (TIGR03803 family)
LVADIVVPGAKPKPTPINKILMKNALSQLAVHCFPLFTRPARPQSTANAARPPAINPLKRSIEMSALMILLGLLPASRSAGQTVTNLHSFTGDSDGGTPTYALVQSGDVLFGTSGYGGSAGNGTIFSINANGTGFKVLHTFSDEDSNSFNPDGANPFYGVILSGGSLYGTAVNGGSHGVGTVYTIATNGTGFKVLYNFTGNADQGNPNEKLVLSGNTLFGATALGEGVGIGNGTIFSINTDGTGYRTLHTFTGLADGSDPKLGVLVSSNLLYGSTGGGSSSFGTIFSMNTDGTGFTTLYTFKGEADGENPSAPILSGATIYGTTYTAGDNYAGTIFSLGTNGTGFKLLHTFSAGLGTSLTNSDGATPVPALLLSGGTLYGTASAGGTYGNGTVFSLATNGTGFVTLHSFAPLTGSSGINGDGATPFAGLILSGATLFGAAEYGGASGNGTLFSLALPLPPAPPELGATLLPNAVVLTWPTNATGFTLQSATNLVSPVAWIGAGLTPAVVNGLNTVTNSLSGAVQFYRLSQ